MVLAILVLVLAVFWALFWALFALSGLPVWLPDIVEQSLTSRVPGL